MSERRIAIGIYYHVREDVKYGFPRWVSSEVTHRTGKGHCAAKSEVLVSLLRGKGIRARYVEGRNPKLRFFSTLWPKMMNAHFWVEAWVDARWLTLDPTPDSGIVRLWGNTRPGMHLGSPEYELRHSNLPPWYKDAYNSPLFWMLRLLSNVALLMFRLSTRISR